MDDELAKFFGEVDALENGGSNDSEGGTGQALAEEGQQAAEDELTVVPLSNDDPVLVAARRDRAAAEGSPPPAQKGAVAWRFCRGDRVVCKISIGWAPGKVVAVDQVDPDAPGSPPLPYVVKLDPPLNTRLLSIRTGQRGWPIAVCCLVGCGSLASRVATVGHRQNC